MASRAQLSAALLCLALGLGLAAPARALTVDAATIKVREGAAALRLKGRFRNVTFEGATEVVLTIDQVGLRLPLDQFKRRRKTLTYRGTASGTRVKRMQVDTRKGRFVVDAEGFVLSGVSNPFALGIGTDLSSDCRMVRVRTKGARAGRPQRVTRLVLQATRGSSEPCGAIAQPRLHPAVVRTGVATPVRVDTEVGAGVDASSLALFRADDAGRPAGDALCALAPGAQSGILGCTATFSADTPGLVGFIVQGRAGTTRVVSPGVSLTVANPPTDADVDAVSAAAGRMVAAWTNASTRLGNSLGARMETLRAIANDPDILSAGLSPDGLDLTVRYRTGWLGGLILNKSSPIENPPAAAQSVSPRRTAAAPAPRGIFRSCGNGNPNPDPDAGAVCCVPPERRKNLGRDVLVWAPGYFAVGQLPFGPAAGGEPGGQWLEDGPPIAQKFRDRACLGFGEPTFVQGEDCTVASVLDFPRYQTVLISSHGVVDKYNRTVLITGERFDRAAGRRHDHGLANGDIQHWTLPSGLEITGVTPEFIASVPSSFPDHSIVYASYCYSSRNGAPNSFLSLGAGAHFGFDWTVNSVYTASVGPQLFEGLLGRLETTGDAYDATTPKTDPHPLVGHIPNPNGHPGPVPNESDPDWWTPVVGANFRLSGAGDVAYVGEPRVTPKTSGLMPGQQVTLTAEVEGKGTCELEHHWHNTADAGHLEEGDDHTSTEPTTTYTAGDDPEEDGDAIGVEVSATSSSKPLGAVCASVDVSVTTTTTVSTTSTTIGCGAGVLAAAQIYEEIRSHVDAFTFFTDRQGEQETHDFTVPITTIDLGPDGGTDARPWNLSASKGSASSANRGNVTWQVSPCQLASQGTIHMEAKGGSDSNGNGASSRTGTYASVQITFSVTSFVPYHLSGFVRATGSPISGRPTERYLKCHSHFGVAEADLGNPSGAPITFDSHSAIYPQEQQFIQCTASRSSASVAGFPDDSIDLEWSFTWNLGVP